MEVKEMDLKTGRIHDSEGFLVNSILALSGGFQDAYTYFARGKVFSNAQTGNIVLMSRRFMTGEWKEGLHYLFPVLAFALGVMISEQIAHKYRQKNLLHWKQIVVLFEIFILLIVGLLPASLNMLATAMVSFSCAMQVQGFRSIRGHSYASTMCIGNLRSGMEGLSIYCHSKDKKDLKKSLYYYGIIIVFALGAGLGGILSGLFHLRAIWISSFLLLITFFIMGREEQ